MNKNMYLKAIEEYNLVAKAIKKIGGAPFDLERLLDELQGVDGLQTQNYDGTYFEIEQDHTILTVDCFGIIPQIEFDESENKCGAWIETNIGELTRQAKGASEK